tara:strand:- start:302 stop:763 length:462 start_codon:yes stop_codon:yes gene_type:complete
MVKIAHCTKQHLHGYKDIPQLDVKEFCFRIGVKHDVPLYTLHGIAQVSISVPPDATGNRPNRDGVSVHNLPSTIEIGLCDDAGDLSCKHPLVSDVKRFYDVASVLLFLDKLANDSTVKQPRPSASKRPGPDVHSSTKRKRSTDAFHNVPMETE